MTTTTDHPSDFIRDIVADDLRAGKYKQICTRFPPEPNGYLHIGTQSRFASTSESRASLAHLQHSDGRYQPDQGGSEYVESIMTDVRWLIDGWADKHVGGAPFYASDYFDRFYEHAVDLIRKGKAYVCDMTSEETTHIAAWEGE